MLFERWGMPPGNDGRYGSGFEEEFRTSVDRQQRTGRPEIKMLFKGVDPARMADPGRELNKVITFRQELVDTQQIFFEEFSDLQQFRKRFSACISHYVQSLAKAPAAGERDDADERPKSTEAEQEAPREVPPENPFSEEGSAFVQGLLSRPAEDGMVSSESVARLRLIAKMLGGQSNDDEWLGAHDANLLYSHRTKFNFSSAERYALATAGLAAFKSENTPLWHWLNRGTQFDRRITTYRAFGPQDAAPRLGAIAAITFLGEPLPSGLPLDRKMFVRRWLAEDTSDGVKLAAIGYLVEWGIPADLEFLRAELGRDAYSTRTTALEAILRIRLRDSGDAAVRELFEADPERVADGLLERIFAKIESVQTAVVREGLGKRDADVRRLTLLALAKRNALTLEDVEKLLTDNTPHVRFEAIRAARSLGKTISTNEAKRILVPAGALNILTNPFSRGLIPAAEADRAFIEVLKEEEVLSNRRRPGEGLALLDVLDRGPFFAHAKRDFSRYEASILQNLNDGYASEFAAYVKGIEDSTGSSRPELVEKARGLEGYVRGELSARALQILCEKGGRKALPVVRQAVERNDLNFCDGPLQFFRQHGEWEDIGRITKWEEQAPRSISVLSMGTPRWTEAAEAILAIGRARFLELLSLELPNPILERLIAKAADATFAQLPDGHLEVLLGNESAAVRKTTCLKCVKALPKKRVSELLDRYACREGQRYYNVIFWLDLGASVPTALARKAATRALAAE